MLISLFHGQLGQGTKQNNTIYKFYIQLSVNDKNQFVHIAHCYSLYPLETSVTEDLNVLSQTMQMKSCKRMLQKLLFAEQKDI